MTYQNVWDAAKAEFKGKFIALNTYIEKMKDLTSNDLRFHFKKLKQSTSDLK